MKLQIMILSVLALCTGAPAVAQTPAWTWAKNFGGTSTEQVGSTVVDASGNLVMAGYFHGTSITFGTTTLTNQDITSATSEIYLVKFDPAGKVIWAKAAHGPGSDLAFEVALDANDNILLSGAFYGTSLTFGSHTLTNKAVAAAFLAKYDANGNVLWARSAGATLSSYAFGIGVCADPGSHIYMAGDFSGDSVMFGSTSLLNTALGGTDMFIAKYDPSGNLLWVKGIGGIDRDWVTDICSDLSGRIYVSGYFESAAIKLGSVTLSGFGNGSADALLARYDASGNAIWARAIAGNANDRINSVDTDPSGNVFCTGYFLSSSVNVGSTTLTNIALSDIFVAKYDNLGTALWAKMAGGSGHDEAYEVSADNSGSVFVSGIYNGTSITIGNNVFNNKGSQSFDFVLIKYDASGNTAWAKSEGGTGGDFGYGHATDGKGAIYLSGHFSSTSLTMGSFTMTNANSTGQTYDGFYARLDDVTGLEEPYRNREPALFPNPTSGTFQIRSEQPVNEIRATDLTGRHVNIETIAPGVFSLLHAAPGMYFIYVFTDKGATTEKLLIAW